MSLGTTATGQVGMIENLLNTIRSFYEIKTFICPKHGQVEAKTFKGETPRCPLCIKETVEFEEINKNNLIRRNQIDFKIKKSQIPPRFINSSFENYRAVTAEQIHNLNSVKNYAMNFKENFLKGNSMILCGNVGTGKTHLSCALAKYIIENFNKTALFLNTIDVFSKIKATYSKKSEIRENEAINQFLQIDLLILDEFGVQIGTETEKLILFRIINGRYEYLKPTILITNLSVAEIKKHEERIFDRLKDNGILLNFTGESNRKSKKI